MWKIPTAAAATLLLCGTLSRTARAQDFVFDGEVPDDGVDHFFLPFEVPEGTVEIEVHHSDLSDKNILDFGIDDPAGHRGWGGGTDEPAIVGVDAASRGYLPGPIAAGEWKVVVGKAKLTVLPARYHVEVFLRTAPTLTAQPERMPYGPVPALDAGPRWYAGDFHVHSLDSTDARPQLEEVVTFAKSRGLDFVVITDHNNHAALSRFASVQGDHDDFLLVPGVEFTTYDGHANAIGATEWVDHKIGLPGVTIEAAGEAYAAQGAPLSINHPALEIGDACIGCAWKHELSLDLVSAVEIATGGWSQSGFIFTEAAVDFWDARCAQGYHLAALGGSDDHRAGVDEEMFQSPIGDPTTMVYADELSVAGILDAVRNGRTVVKLQGPDDPMIELLPSIAREGDRVRAEQFQLRARVTGGAGDRLRLVVDGEVHSDTSIASDPFEHVVTVVPPAQGEARWRAEVWSEDGEPRTITSHLWASYLAGVGTPPAAKSNGGCGCAVAGAAPLRRAWVLVALALALSRRRRASRSRSRPGGPCATR